MTEIEDEKSHENWKTTKEVAKAFGISTTWIRGFYSKHKQMFEGLTTRFTEKREGKVRARILWSLEAIKILGLNIQNLPVKDWEKSIIKEVRERGLVVTKTSDLNLIKSQAETILNLINAEIQHHIEIESNRKDIGAMQLELKDTTKKVIDHINQEKEKESIQDETTKKIRDLIQQVYDTHGRSIWRELHERFGFSALPKTTEKKGKEIIRYIEKCYYEA